MPISPIVLQRRHAELGRIRLGAKKDGRGRPMKLESFRFTSPSETYIRDLAELYGGTPQPWDNNGVASYEVFTTATSVPVIAVKGGLSQWMETWSGGGCVHRCDGERGADGELCNPQDPGHVNAKPTTRLSVMLPELDAIGVWRMESHGWNAAAEIPAVAELAQYVGDLVPAELHLVERRAVKDGKTSRFVVPVLDLRIGQARLREIVAEKSGAGLELAAPSSSGAAAIEAPRPAAVEAPQVKIPTREQIAAADEDLLRKMRDYLEQNAPGHPATRAVSDRLDEVIDANADAPGPDAEGVYEAQVVDEQPGSPAAPGLPGASDPDPDVVWEQIVKAAGAAGMSLADLQDDFSARMGGLTADTASGAELQHYLTLLTGERAA